MAVAFRNVSHNTTSSATSVAITQPAGATVGDIILLWVLVQVPQTVTTPTGYTLLNSWLGTNCNVYLYWTRDWSAVTVNFSASVTYAEYSCCAYSGCETSASPIDAAAYAAVRTGTDAPNCPSVTTLSANTVVIAFGAKWGGSTGAKWGAGGSYTLRDDGVIAGLDLCVMDRSVASPGLEDPPAFTNNSTSSDTIAEGTVVLEPPADGGVASINLCAQICM